MNNKSIALNVLQVDEQQKTSYRFKSKHNKTRKDKVILLILENKHYVAVKNLNALLKDKNDYSKHFCVDCLKSFSTKLGLKNIINHFHNH